MPEKLRLFNTMTRSVVDFTPPIDRPVHLYCCGPTVYNFQHIGNMRTYIFEDLLVRTIKKAGLDVDHVMNITDVGHLVSDGDEGEDKMAVAMKREKKRSEEIAQYYTDIFFDDCRKLGIVRPKTVCKATEHIQEMINLIKQLMDSGAAYVAGGNVYFDVSKADGYGKLARLDLNKLEVGARIEVDSNKKNPHDFVLWFTKSKFENQELQWDSPWGRGYPGWHIECSAMAIKYLGEQFDIHCGGIDHVPVHHTNEIAQSEAATGKSPWVTIWMHGEFLVNEKNEKMAKSTGGFICLKDLEERGIDPIVYRFFCLSAHYRKQLSFSWDALTGAAQTLSKLKAAVIELKRAAAASESEIAMIPEGRRGFFEAFFNDLNAPQALASLWGTLGDPSVPPRAKLTTILDFDEILGLGMADWEETAAILPQEVLALIGERDAARRNKDFAASDRIRNELVQMGYVVEDSSSGTRVKSAR
jgi:cysteinyl-tRNA synthetase